jgi:hypothetical protein
MEKIVIRPQKSEMGSGFGIIQFEEGTTLGQILTWYKENSCSWGNVTIIVQDEEKVEYPLAQKVLYYYPKRELKVKKFDYNTYGKNVFNYNIEEKDNNFLVKKAEFDYCYMNENLTIYI